MPPTSAGSDDSVDYPAPDLAVEVNISAPQVDRPAIYATIRVPEIWRFTDNKVHIDHLREDGTYTRSRSSRFLPVRDRDIQRWLIDEDRRDELAWEERLTAWAQGLAQPRAASAAPARIGRMTSATSRKARPFRSARQLLLRCVAPSMADGISWGHGRNIVFRAQRWERRVNERDMAGRLRFLVLVAGLGLILIASPAGPPARGQDSDRGPAASTSGSTGARARRRRGCRRVGRSGRLAPRRGRRILPGLDVPRLGLDRG